MYVGQNHSVFLTTDGEVWTCGAGEYGRCGNGGTGDQLVPAPLEAFENHVIVEIKARSPVRFCRHGVCTPFIGIWLGERGCV